MELGGVGIWSAELRFGEAPDEAEALAELDELGYTAAWMPDANFDVLRRVLESTQSMVAASGIINIWSHDASDVGAGYASLAADHPGRLLVGLGVGHAKFVEGRGLGRYENPLNKMRQYLDELDAASPSVPVADRVLAALGPKMLQLTRDRSGGAHPYIVTPEHTAEARATLGYRALLAPGQQVILETDPARARELARSGLALYLTLPNYVSNWRRLGFTEEDVANGGSNRLVDHVVAWGDEAAIAARVQEHLTAGADHVCVQVVAGTDRSELPRAAWRALAPALVDLTSR